MLKTFTLANFKSYCEATLDLSPLTLLIGANASGKSNALEALQMLSWLSQGRRLEVFQRVQGAESLVRGTVFDLIAQGAATFSLGCVLEDHSELVVEMSVGEDGMRIVQETLKKHGESLPLYRIDQPASEFSHDLLVGYNNFARGPNKPQITCTDQQAVFTQLLTPARFAEQHKKSQEEIPRAARAFIQALENTLFLDPMPRRMRGYSFIVDKTLKGDGSNVSSTVHDLCVTQEKKDQVLEFIRDLPEQNISDVKFLEGPRKEVMVQLEETFGGTRKLCDAALLSDGTLRVLAVAAALLSAPAGSTVVIEELDNGVHPSRVKALLEKIQQTAHHQRLAVLLTSHNPTLLDAVPVSAVPDVVFCYRDPRLGDSRLVQLSKLADYPELVAQGPLGRLVTQGVVDRFAKDTKNPEHKVQASLAWIERLEKAARGT